MTLQLRAYSRSVVQRLGRLPWRHGLSLAWQGAIALGCSVFCLLLLAWFALQWAILPHIEDWRPTIERHASEAIGVPMRIGSMRVNSSGWIPALELRDVVLSDPSGGEALRLPRVAAAITPRSVLTPHPRFAQLYVEGARLVIRRDAQGRLHVGGLDMARSTTVDNGHSLDWFFRQQEIVIRHGELRWVDEARGAPPLQLSDVDVVVRNGLRSHQLRVDATPPADWGDRFAVRMKFVQPLFAGPGNWRRWSGTMFVDLPRGDVAQLRRHVDLPFALDRGRGALRAWIGVQSAAWRDATVDLRLDDVAMRFADTPQPLAIAHASGRLDARHDAHGASLSALHFGFVTADGVAWPAGDLRLSWQQRAPSAAGAAPGAAGLAADTGASAISALWSDTARVTGGQLSADRLDLGLMARLADGLPLPPSARRWLAETRPSGLVHQLAVRWEGSLDRPDKYRVAARLEQVSISSAPADRPGAAGRPGWRNVSMRLEAAETGGHADLALDGGALELPGVLEEPVIPFDTLAGRIDWKIQHDPDPRQPPRLSVDVDGLRFANADAEGELTAHWRSGDAPVAAAAAPSPASRAAPANGDDALPTVFPAKAAASPPVVARAASGPASNAVVASTAGAGRFPGWIDLHGTLVRGRASRIARYLPVAMQADARTWLRDAFQGGDLSAGRFQVRGNLDDFPFQHGRDGEFRLSTHVENLGLDYVPAARPADDPQARVASDWPAFHDVRADVLIDHGVLEIRNGHARVREIELRDVQGAIRSLYEAPVLAIRGRAQGPMADYLRYVDESPVGGWIGHGLQATTAAGTADLDLSLGVPLLHADRSTVHGVVTLAGNDLRFLPGTPMLSNVRAAIDFTEKGFTVANAQARALGGEASIDGGMQADGSLRFTATGVATAEGLRRASDDPAVARLGGLLAGQAPYRLQLGVVHGLTELAVTSPLTGLSINLPAPLAKGAADNWPLRVQSTLAFDASGRANPRDTWRVELGSVAAGEFQREYVNGSPRVLRSAWSVGGPLPAPQAGGVAQLRLGAVDGDAWWSAVRTLAEGGAASGNAGAAGGAGAVSGGEAGGSDVLPRNVSLRAQDLLVGGRHLTGVQAQVGPVAGSDGERWRVSIASDQTHGVVEVLPGNGSRTTHVYARLDRLALASGDGGGAGGPAASSGTAPDATTSVPALDIVVDDLEVNGKKLGRLEVAATQADRAHDWRLDRLALTTPEARFAGSGHWSSGAVRHMALDFTLDLADSGAYLERLGFGRVIKGGKGRLAGKVSWTGSPLALDYPTLGGQLQLSLDTGQFLKADAGAARLLGVLSLQSLPRRLLFDFRDLFQEGFAFDNVGGDIVIDHGVARTNNLRIRSVSAAVLMEGRTDLRAETQDLHVVVVPEINAGTASLAYAVINPVVGLGTFLAQMFLRRPLMAAGTRELHVTGTWSDPKVETLDRHLADGMSDRVDGADGGDGAPAGGASPTAAAVAAPPASASSAPRPAASGTIAP